MRSRSREKEIRGGEEEMKIMIITLSSLFREMKSESQESHSSIEFASTTKAKQLKQYNESISQSIFEDKQEQNKSSDRPSSGLI